MIASQIHNKLVKLKRVSKTDLRETNQDVIGKETSLPKGTDWNRKIMEINNLIWSPPDGLSEEDIVSKVRRMTLNIEDRARKTWPRSPLNVAVHKMQRNVVEMLVKQAEFYVDSVDEIKDCQRTPLTIAISRAKADLEKSLDMIRFLVVELKADINKTLLWKRKSETTCGCDVREFTGLHWAISLDIHEVVRVLIELGADLNQRGCLLNKSKIWVCGSPLKLALKINSSKEVIQILESGEIDTVQNDSSVKTTIYIGKPSWKTFLNQANSHVEDSDEKLRTALRLLNKVNELTADPDYLTEEQIKLEKHKIENAIRCLDFKISRTLVINQEIAKLKADKCFLKEEEVRQNLYQKKVFFEDGPSLA